MKMRSEKTVAGHPVTCRKSALALVVAALLAQSGPAGALVAITKQAVGGNSCEADADEGNPVWNTSNDSRCHPAAGTGASGVGNPGTNLIIYSSSNTGTTEDSIAVGGFMDVWKRATFWGGADMQNTRILNLSPGALDTDAANVGQLRVVTNALGGGAAINPDGSVTGPTYQVGGTTYTTVGGAIGSLDAAVNGGGGIKYFHANSSDADASAQGAASIAVGPAAVASASFSQAMGASAVAAGDTSLAIGASASATAAASRGVAVGPFASVAAANGLALGADSSAGQAGAVALGAGATTAAAVGTAGATIADTAYTFAGTTPASTVSIGTTGAPRTLTNLAAGRLGTTSTDAVNGSQLNATNLEVGALDDRLDTLGGDLATALGGGAVYSATTGDISAPAYQVGGTTYNSVGTAIGALDSSLTAINNGGIKYFHTNSTDVDSSATGFASTAIGPVAVASGAFSQAMGGNAFAAGNTSIAIGDRATTAAAATRAVALGPSATGSAVNATALGNAAVANQAGAVALGASSATGPVVATTGTTIAGTAYTFAGGAPTSTVSIGLTSFQRTLTNLGAGRLSATSTDGINGSQLFATNQAVEAVNAQVGLADDKVDALGGDTATRLGGGATYDPATGSLSPPTYIVGGSTVNSVGDAITNLDGRTTNNTNAITNLGDAINNGTTGLVRQDPTTRQLTVGAATDGTLVDFTGTAGTRRLTGVSIGAVTATSTDAINGSQLFAGNTSIANALGGGSTVNPDGSLGAPTFQIGGDTFNSVDAALQELDQHIHDVSVGATKYFHANSTLGDSAAAGTDSLAVGPLAVAGGTDAISLGRSATASQAGAVAIGAASVTAAAVATPGATIAGTAYTFAGSAPTSTVSIGAVGAERTLTNLAAGRISATSTDALNGSQLFATNQSVETINTQLGAADAKVDALGGGTAAGLGGGATYDPATGTLTPPTYQVGGNTYNNVGGAIGDINTTLGSIGAGAGVKYFRVRSAGADATPTGDDSLAAGPLANAEGTSAIAIGHDAGALSNDTVAIGHGAVAGVSGGNSGETAVGANAQATADNAAAFGAGATAAQVGAVALGAASQTAAAVATTSGVIAGTTYAYAGTAPASTVSIGAVGAERTLTNVAAGRVSATSTDGINGSQLFATNQAVEEVNTQVGAADDKVDALGGGTAAGLGGGATYDPATGTLTPPSYSVGGGTVNNAGDAITNLDGRTTNNTNAITNLGDAINNGSVGLVQQNATTRQLTVGAATDGTLVDFTGTAGTRQLTGVSIGAVTATSTDAINGSQLFAANTSIAAALGGGSVVNPDGSISAPSYQIDGTTFNNVNDALENLDGHLHDISVGATKYFRANSGLADSSAAGANSLAIGPETVAAGSDALAMGHAANAAQDGAVALGSGSVTDAAVGTSGVTLAGTTYAFAGATPASTVSIGSAGNERTLTNLAAGRISADSTDAVNGSQLYATNQSVEGLSSLVGAISSGGGIKYFRANATGVDASATGTDSIAIGPAATASAANGIALGNAASATHENSIALGAGTQTTTGAQTGYSGAYVGSSTSVGEVALGGRTISGVAAGSLGTDAVNVSQLTGGVDNAISIANAYTDNRLSQFVGQPGGDSALFRVSAPTTRTPTVAGTNAVAGGSGAVASGAESVALGNDSAASGASSMALGHNAQANGDNSIALGAGSVASVANTVSVGSAGNERTVSNVAAGVQATDAVNVGQLQQTQAGTAHYDTDASGGNDYANLSLGGPGAATTTRVHNVSAGVAPTDAVNVQQLESGLGQARQYVDMRLQDVGQDMWTMRREMRGGTASAMAMAGMPQAYEPGRNMVAVGVGGFQGEVGMAVGMSRVSESGRYLMQAQMSGNTTRDFGFSVGAGWQW